MLFQRTKSDVWMVDERTRERLLQHGGRRADDADASRHVEAQHEPQQPELGCFVQVADMDVAVHHTVALVLWRDIAQRLPIHWRYARLRQHHPRTRARQLFRRTRFIVQERRVVKCWALHRSRTSPPDFQNSLRPITVQVGSVELFQPSLQRMGHSKRQTFSRPLRELLRQFIGLSTFNM